MASNKSKHKPLTAMQRGMSDIVSYEDILVAQYMNQIEKSPPTRKPSKDVPVSPYALATRTGEMTKSKRPKSAIALHQKRKELESSRALAISQGRVPFMAWDDEGAGDIEHVPRIMTKKRPTSASTTRSRSSVLSGAGSAYSRSSKSLYSQGSVAGSRVKRNKPLYKKQPKVICVRAFQNGNRDNFARVTAPDLSQLIDNCTIKLGLVSAARKLFFSDGTLITDARQIEKDADVYVSCGEAFKDPYSTLKAKEELRRSASWTLTGIVLPENKSRGKTKTSLSKRMQTLVESQKRRILVFRNGESAEGVEIVAARFDEFLDDCTYKLKLESGARCLFDWEGNEIKSFRDVPVLERILQPSTTTVLGPVWVTRGGERFSPKGAYNFLLTLISNTKERLKYSKLFKEQLEMQANHSPDVQLKEVMSMTDEEVHTEIQQVEEHISELSSVMPTLKKQIKFLQESVESEGGMETMKYQHISEIKSDSRLLGKQGLRLKVFENGRNDGEVIVYFNLAEAEKGIQGDNSQLMHRFLDTCTSSQRVGDGTGGPAGRRIAKRVFLKDGTEVTDVHSLEYDQEVWLSYGEEFKPLNVMALQLTLDKASCMSLWDELEIVQREAIMDDEKGKDRPTAWRAVTGFPPGNKRQLINLDMPGPQRLSYAKGLQKSRVDEKGCFLQYREKKNLVLYPELIVDIKKKKGAKDVWPSDAQEWVITQGGIIFSKAMPQLALAKSEHAVQVKVSDDTAAGFSVHLAKRSANDINQQWGFSPTGQIYSLAKPSLFLTYVAGYEVTMVTDTQPSPVQAPDDSHPENEEQDVGTSLASLNFLDLNGSNEEDGDNEDEGDQEADTAGRQEEESTAPGLADLEAEFGGKNNAVVLLPKLSGKAGLQRWAVKQEDLASIGQWKHTTVANPEWNKKALSWPVTEDGNWNTEYSWPMEGFLLPLAPPVKRPSEKKSTFPGSAVRLRVMKNGDSDQSRMAVVVGPDLTNMWHDVGDVGNSSKKKRRPGGRSPSESTAAVYQSDACHPLDCKRIELELFLDQCTQALGLPFAGRRLFDEEGREVTCISDLSRDQLVFVSCGENWIDPQMSYSEQQRRALLMNLASDIAHIRQYCALRDPTDLVLDVDGPVLPGTRVVVETCLLSSVEKEELIKRLKDEDEDEVEDEDAISPAALLSYAVTAHERAHQRADERLKSLRWSWENDKTSKGDQELEGQDEGDFNNEIAFSDPVLQKKFARQRIKSGDTKHTVSDPSFRQRWHYSDGFIHLKKNSQFVLGLEDGLKEGTASNEVVVCKKKLEDPSQRWIVSEDGSICLRSNVQLVLTVTTPPLGNDPFSYDRALDHGYRGSAVIVATKKSCANGNCHQLWSIDRLTGFIEAFASDTTNREITSANKSNVCTYAVLGQREVYQLGYVYMPGTSREKLLCEACGRASRGKNKLQRLKESRRFACFIGTNAENSSDGKLSGCFKCLNSKVDLSTLEAESTLELWEYQLDRLRNEGNVRTITKELNVAKSVPAVRILAYKNGEGSRGQGVLVIGSSIHSLLDQATTRLGLTQAARRLYTVRGELITDIHQLVRPYNASMARSLQETEEVIPEKAEAKTKKKEAVRSIPNGDAVDYIEAENKRYYDSSDSSKEVQKLDLQELEDKVDDDDVESGNDTYRLGKGRKRRSLPTVMQDPSGFPRWDTRWPIDVWISCGEPFVPLEEADKQYLLSMKHREERTWIQAYLDMEKHVLRQMQGRRKGGFSPPQSPTKDPTRKEEHKEETINELKMHLLDVKSRQKNEELALSKSAKESTQRLYSTPKTVRIKVFPNGESIDRAVVVYGASIREILDNSTSRLGLSSAARRIFKQDGQEVLELDHIRRGETFCVSCGDNFIRARERRHQMELKATWSRMARSPGGNILTQSGNVHAADEAGSNSVQLALPAPPCSPSTAFKGQQHPVGEVSVHTLQGRSKPFHRS